MTDANWVECCMCPMPDGCRANGGCAQNDAPSRSVRPAAESEVERLRAENTRLRAALEYLNAELDAYWNDPSQAGKRPPEAYIQNITNAQIASRSALEDFAKVAVDAVAGQIAAEARRQALEEAATVAAWAHMVPPDGGSPTEDECRVAEAAADSIRALIEKDANDD